MKVMKIRFGKSGANVDGFGIRLYGDVDGDCAKLGSVSEIFSDTEPSHAIKSKRITVWFTFEKIRPYQGVSHFLDDVVQALKNDGYEIIYSSVDDLVDTSSPEYQGRPESLFPHSQRIHGYNAAGGFSVTAEKSVSTSILFSYAEIEGILAILQKTGRIIYGKVLKKY